MAPLSRHDAIRNPVLAETVSMLPHLAGLQRKAGYAAAQRHRDAIPRIAVNRVIKSLRR